MINNKWLTKPISINKINTDLNGYRLASDNRLINSISQTLYLDGVRYYLTLHDGEELTVDDNTSVLPPSPDSISGNLRSISFMIGCQGWTIEFGSEKWLVVGSNGDQIQLWKPGRKKLRAVDLDYHVERIYDDASLIKAFNKSDLIKTWNNLEELKAASTVGFELETQATNGATSHNLAPLFPAELTDTMWNEWMAKPIADFNLFVPDSPFGGLISHLGLERAHEFCGSIGITTVADLLSKQLIATEAELRELILEEIGRNRSYSREDAFKKMPKTIEAGNDSSVSGFEFRTKGGLKVEKWEKNIKYLFDTYNHTIDDRCSFHIHIDPKDYRFKSYNRSVQRALMEYLITNADRAPETVRKRWQNGNANYFCMPKLNHDKNTFVHFHSLGTLEFRCFGNIQSAEEAMACLELAFEAILAVRGELDKDEPLPDVPKEWESYAFTSLARRQYNLLETARTFMAEQTKVENEIKTRMAAIQKEKENTLAKLKVSFKVPIKLDRPGNRTCSDCGNGYAECTCPPETRQQQA